MQYKKVPRIAFEIFDIPDTPVEIRLTVLRFLASGRSFPKLGPYRKRSPEQVLWRIASNAQLGGAERWEALMQLLEMNVTTAEGGGAPQRKPLGEPTTDQRIELAERVTG